MEKSRLFYEEKEFKDTEIGKIPRDWDVVKLEDVATYVKGKKPKFMTGKNPGGYLPYLSTDYLRSGKPTQFVKTTEDVIMVKDGEIILLWDGSNAGEFFLGKKGVLSSTMVRFDLKKNYYDGLFLFYLLKKEEVILKDQTRGTGIPHVDKDVLNGLNIPLPPLSEQQQIASILSATDQAIQKTDEVIAKTERLKKGLMQELLTKGIGHKEYKQTPIGTIPKTWEITRLKDKASIKEGVYGKRGEKGVIQLKADSILDSGRINVNAYALISVDKKIDDYLLEPGDIILSNRNSAELVGKCAIFRGEFNKCVFSNLLTRIRVNSKDVLPEWLLYILTKMKNDGLLRAFSTRAVNQVLLKKELVENIKVSIPSISEQQEIVTILSAIDDKLELEKKEKGKLERIKRGLMDLLLTGKIKVRVEN